MTSSSEIQQKEKVHRTLGSSLMNSNINKYFKREIWTPVSTLKSLVVLTNIHMGGTKNQVYANWVVLETEGSWWYI